MDLFTVTFRKLKSQLTSDGTISTSDVEMASTSPRGTETRKTIEDYMAGYPRFCALLAANPDFLICRRFLRLRSRLLLAKQDKLSQLEQRLDDLDNNETMPLFLGRSRGDRNTARTCLLDEISSRMEEYDAFLDRTDRMLRYSQALPRDVASLRNWVGNGSLSREETDYLTHENELLCLAPTSDTARKRFEDWVEDVLVDHFKGFRTRRGHNTSSDPNTYLYSGGLIKGMANAIMLVIISILLLMPVVICILVEVVWARIGVITVSIVVYLFILAHLTKAKMIELILAGATFATILNVFVVGINSN